MPGSRMFHSVMKQTGLIPRRPVLPGLDGRSVHAIRPSRLRCAPHLRMRKEPNSIANAYGLVDRTIPRVSNRNPSNVELRVIVAHRWN